MVVASDKQLEVLQQSKAWYMDATFKLSRQPFTQLLMLNVFVKNGDFIKQAPLIVVGKKKSNCKAVLQSVISILPGQPSVKKVTLDCEKAMWSAIRQVLPNVIVKGCSFHLTQAIWRKVSSIYQNGAQHEKRTLVLVKASVKQL